MSYIPHTPADREHMLRAIGVAQLEDLFDDVPEHARFPRLRLPEPLSEMEVLAETQAISEANADAGHFPCFLGAGAYHHFIPPVVDEIINRGEFYTAYTPYQPEVAQGTLQAIFEFQSMIANLTGLDVANASHYDGATALAEGVLLAYQQSRGRRKKVIVTPGVHPQYRAVARTYTQGLDIRITGDEDLAATAVQLREQLDADTACFVIQQPNFFGELEDVRGLADAVHAAGALLIVVCEPISLGLLQPPGAYGADVACGEGQPLGVPVNFGGPYVGFFATRSEYVRKMGGRLVGETLDRAGRRGYVLTLTPREQHIRRERATSNICTNQGLMALAACVYMATMGKAGLKTVAELCYHKAHYAAAEIGRLPGFAVTSRDPWFMEFVVRCPQPVAALNQRLMQDYGIIGGYDLGRDYPHLADQMLVCVTETVTRDEIDEFVEALRALGGQS
jgi:glycine dehydrogenase subunit 1